MWRVGGRENAWCRRGSTANGVLRSGIALPRAAVPCGRAAIFSQPGPPFGILQHRSLLLRILERVRADQAIDRLLPTDFRRKVGVHGRPSCRARCWIGMFLWVAHDATVRAVASIY